MSGDEKLYRLLVPAVKRIWDTAIKEENIAIIEIMEVAYCGLNEIDPLDYSKRCTLLYVTLHQSKEIIPLQKHSTSHEIEKLISDVLGAYELFMKIHSK